MARETDKIERDIERAREELASTLDELAVRANPKRLADSAKQKVLGTLEKPAVRYGMIGAGVLAASLVIVKIIR